MIDYKQIYDIAFSYSDYNVHSMDESRFEFVTRSVKLDKISKMIDISCGTGTLLKYIQQNYPNITYIGTDISQYGEFPITKLDLTNQNDWNNISQTQLITCMDVLEHIEEEYMTSIIKNLARKCAFAVITVANHEEIRGDTDLHVTKQNLNYWVSVINKDFYIVKMENSNDRSYYFLCVSRLT